MVKRDLGWERYSEIKKKYGEKIKIDVPENLGVALFSSVSDEISAKQVLSEFGILPIDEFFTNDFNKRKECI